MGVMAALASALATFYPDAIDPNFDLDSTDLRIARLIAKMPTLAAWAYKNSLGHPVNYPKNKCLSQHGMIDQHD